MLNTNGRLASDPGLVCESIRGAHILVCTESWVGSDVQPLAFPGYTTFHFPQRMPGHTSSPRGGVVVYVHASISQWATIWRDCGTHAWLRIAKDVGLAADLMLLAAYFPPRSQHRSRTGEREQWDALEAEVAAAQAQGMVLMAGDFNARTAELPDWDVSPAGNDVPNPAQVEALWQALGLPPPVRTPRRNQDKGDPNVFGRRLLQLCRETGMRICNGRTPGDLHGACTCYPYPGGQSQVDLYLACPCLMPSVSRLTVAPMDGVTDHCRVNLWVQRPESTPTSAPTEQFVPYEVPPAIPVRWDADQAEAWAGLLEASEMQQRLTGVIAAAHAAQTAADLGAMADEFTEVLRSSLTQVMPAAPPPQHRTPHALRHLHSREAQQAKREMRRQLRRLGPGSHAYQAAAREYRRLVRMRRRELRRRRGEVALRIAQEDMNKFWRRIWAPLARSSLPTPQITPHQWHAYFQQLLAPQTGRDTGEQSGEQQTAAVHEASPPAPAAAQPPTPQFNVIGLEGPISALEIGIAIEDLNRHRAVLGPERVEFLKAGFTPLSAAMVAMLNACRRLGELGTRWAISAITPILKAGDISDPSNYRGIAVGTLMAKVYALVLHTRVNKWAEGAGIRAKGQAGFRHDRRATDHIFVLHTLIEAARRAGIPLYACFVDFRKAYDLIRRHLLWAKLQSRGMPAGLLNAIKVLYADVPMSVRTAEGLSQPFHSSMGVKQGCPLSPTLFGLFIDDFEELIMGTEGCDLPQLHNTPIPPLMYADDLLLVSTSAEGLQKQLDALEPYSTRWCLTVNVDKTKAMVFRPTPRSCRHTQPFTYQGEPIEQVDSFRYLGVVLHCTQPFGTTATAPLAESGWRALHSMRRKVAELGVSNIPLQVKLFHALVAPVVSYGAEVWAPRYLSADGEEAAAEKLYRAFLRSLLGVRDSTPGGIVLAEAGRYPLATHWAKLVARYWNRLVEMRPDRLPKLAFAEQLALSQAQPEEGRPARQLWVQQACRVLGDMQLEPMADGAPRLVDAGSTQDKSCDRYAARVAADTSAKVQYYCTVVRPGLTAESWKNRPAYISTVDNRAQRRHLAQLRTGSHWLQMEQGRFAGLERSERLCPHCDMGAVEDEEHMIFQCPHYSQIRERYAALFGEGAPTSVHGFLHQDAISVANFVHECAKLVHA